MPEIIMVDEIGTEAEALACRTIAERGVQLVATAHGQLLENLIKNPTLSDLVGGIQSVTLGMLRHYIFYLQGRSNEAGSGVSQCAGYVDDCLRWTPCMLYMGLLAF